MAHPNNPLALVRSAWTRARDRPRRGIGLRIAFLGEVGDQADLRWTRVLVSMALGLIVYFCYGRRHSVLGLRGQRTGMAHGVSRSYP